MATKDSTQTLPIATLSQIRYDPKSNVNVKDSNVANSINFNQKKASVINDNTDDDKRPTVDLTLDLRRSIFNKERLVNNLATKSVYTKT